MVPAVPGTALAGSGAHGSELTQRARSSALVVAVTALLVVPAWSLFDLALEPDHARDFIRLRLLCDLPILATTLYVWRGRPAQPEVLAFGVLCVVQLEIGWMVSRANDNRQFYLLGFTLALYGGGLLLAGSAWWTVGLVGVTALSFTAFELTAPQLMTTDELIGATTFLSTAAVISVLSHAQRRRLTTREFAVRARLEEEQEHGRSLLARVERLSREDPLTGLANRRHWDEQLALECERAHREGTEVAVVLLDLDRFKEINDLIGHAGGDDALRCVTAVMQQRIPERGLVARLGGDELAMLLPGMGTEQAAALAERVRRDVGFRRTVRTREVRLSVSQGVTSGQGRAATPATLMHQADQELYRAKKTRDAVSAARCAPSRTAVPGPRHAPTAQHPGPASIVSD